MQKKLQSMVCVLALCLSLCAGENVYAASKVTINKTSLSLTVGKTAKLKLKNLSKKKAKKSKWKSTKKSVATVTFNKSKAVATVKAKKKGTAKIKVTYNKKTYLCKVTVKAKKSTATITPADIDLETQKLPVTGIQNARQLGGYKTTDGKTVKSNCLLRTAKLSDATDEDLTVLKNQYNLGYIVDLRAGASEKKTKTGGADPTIDGVTEIYAGFSGPSETDADGYVDSLKESETIEAMKIFLQTLVDNKGEKAVLFHCSKGKDRTGIMAATLLSILHVSDEIIMGDYMLSSNYYDSCNQLGMENALLYMKEQSGSVENFVIEQTGLTSADMDALRTYYLE